MNAVIPYEVAVWTGDKRGAGTDAKVHTQLLNFRSTLCQSQLLVTTLLVIPGMLHRCSFKFTANMARPRNFV